jgi:hypothetical protein
MKHKLTQRQEKQQETTEVQKAAESEFQNAEDLLRHDALHTPVPPGIARRLQESLDKASPSPTPWWRRFLP